MEIHTTYICGIPLIEKCVFINDGKSQQSLFEPLLNPSRAVPVAVAVIILILSVVVCFGTTFTIQTRPEKFHRENTEGSLQELDEKLSEAKDALKTATQQNENLNQEISGITTNGAELTKKLKETETELSSLKTELESAKERESKLQEQNENLEQDKDTLTKDLSATKFTLGNCKNKNMDHEVRSLELLQEIEGLKKELKAC